MSQNSLLWALALASGAAVAAAVLAILAAVKCSRMCSALSATMRASQKSVVALDDIRESIATLNDRYENLRSRVGMREVRAHRGAGVNGSDGLTGTAWKEAKRRELWPSLVPASKKSEQ